MTPTTIPPDAVFTVVYRPQDRGVMAIMAICRGNGIAARLALMGVLPLLKQLRSVDPGHSTRVTMTRDLWRQVREAVNTVWDNHTNI